MFRQFFASESVMKRLVILHQTLMVAISILSGDFFPDTTLVDYVSDHLCMLGW